jgi:transmembrane 9 superfamily member 2/4
MYVSQDTCRALVFLNIYQIRMLEANGTCQTLCTVRDVPGEDAKFINDRIREDYALNWLIDGLPAAEMKVDLRNDDLFFDMGFNLGNDDEPHAQFPALNNHYEIVLRLMFSSSLNRIAFANRASSRRYHNPSPERYRVVGVLVWPSRYRSSFLRSSVIS